MIGLLVSLLVIVVVFGIVWVILGHVPIPPDVRWIVNVVFLIIFLIALLGILTGTWTFPVSHWR
jgi:heme A synthase